MALTFGGLKMNILYIMYMGYLIIPLVITFGADPKKPYSKIRRFLLRYYLKFHISIVEKTLGIYSK